MTVISGESAVQLLLASQPWLPVAGCPELNAYCAPHVIELWEQFEVLTAKRQQPPFWATVWPGAALLARVLLNHPELVADRRVVDVGCGAGVAAIAAAKAGAATAIGNDIDGYALLATRINAERNGVDVATLATDLTQSSELEWGPSDTVLVSEMFYDAVAAARMWDWLQKVHDCGVQVVLADGGRPFFRASGLNRLSTATLPAQRDLEGVAELEVTVYQMCS